MIVLCLLSLASQAQAWHDKTHLAIAKAAGFNMWYHCAGPDIAKNSNSLGAIAIDVLNKGLRPFLVKWHPLLKDYEEKKSPAVTTVDHERAWEHAVELRQELEQVRQQMVIYVDALSKIAGIL